MFLCAKSAREAKERFQAALGRLLAYWDWLRTPEQTLTPLQVKALAGKTYLRAVERLDADFDFNDRMEAFVQEYRDATQWHLDDGVDDPKVAERMASIEMQDPLVLHAYALRHGDGVLNREEIVDAAFGGEARQLVADNQMQIDQKSLARLSKELVKIGEAFSELAMRRLSSADHSDNIGKNLPAWKPPTPATTTASTKADREPESMSGLHKRWCDYQTGKKAASTLRRYGSSRGRTASRRPARRSGADRGRAS